MPLEASRDTWARGLSIIEVDSPLLVLASKRRYKFGGTDFFFLRWGGGNFTWEGGDKILILYHIPLI